MKVHIRWNNISDGTFGNRNKIYDFDSPQDYTISGRNQMWYNELSWLGGGDLSCSTIWVNDELVYDIDSVGWIRDGYWYKEMQISIQQEGEFNEIVNAFNKTERIIHN